MSSAFEGLPKTPNLKLNKPGYDNVADIEALNENSDILDDEINTIKSNLKNKGSATEPIYFDGNGVPQKTKKFTDYLPLAGGTMTGAISADFIGNIFKSKNWLIRDDGERFYILKKSGADGWTQDRPFTLVIDSNGVPFIDTTTTPLENYSNRVATTKFVKDHLANYEKVDSIGDNYVRYKSGLQICWGIELMSNGYTLTFPQPFADTNYGITLIHVNGEDTTVNYIINAYTTTNCIVKINNAYSPKTSYIIIGTWK